MRRKIFKIIKWLVIVILILCCMGITWNYFCKRREIPKIQAAYGKAVKVNGKKMTVEIAGLQAEETPVIVLLPGLGSPSPVLEFRPLAEELGKTCKVITMEPFGYGLSDPADTERSIENIVEELHACLEKIGVRRYYLMAHSISGLYSLYYANTYPEEVRGFIGIDETILDNRRRGRTNSAKEEINYILHESVLYSGLLPHYRFSNLGQGVDMSAIKGSEGKEYPIVIPKIADLCTSNMRFVYEHPTTGVNQNLVKLDGENVSAFHYLKEINAGFEDAYKYVLENKEKFLEYADMFGNLNIRHLVQDTQRYSMLLHTSFHPDFMQDGRDRQMFLCSLFKQYEATQGDKGVVKCEIKDMLNMDIPYFYLNTSDKSLFGSEGEKIEDYFEYTSLEHLKKKIVLLDEDDLKRQLMFMNIILTEINEFQVEDKKIELQQMKMIPHREKNKAHLLKSCSEIG